MDARAPEQFVPGDLLADRFKLARVLGQGAMGTVWLAHDTHMDDDPVACKLLSGALTHDRRAVAYLKREVLLTRRLRHTHILAVYTFWDTDALYFITMEYVPGENLSNVLSERDAPFAPEEALPWIGQICEALDYAHEQDVLHRDVKPANVLIDTKGAARLADFGIARTLSDMHSRVSGGVTCGTVMFMSPEQLMGEHVDRRSDLYSLAASVYELLAGLPPFHSGSIVAQIQARPAPAVEHLPPEINAVLLRALSKDRDARHPSCTAFHEDLAAAAREHAGGAAPAGLMARRQSDPDSDTVKLDPADLGAFPDRLGAVLVEAGAATVDQVEEALRIQLNSDERLGEILLRLGYVSELEMAQALERQLRIPLISLDQECLEPEVTALIGRAFAEARRCLPVRRVNDRVLVVMADPLDFATLNVLEETCGGQVMVRIATLSDVLEAVRRAYG